MTPAPRPTTALRRTALLLLPALCALTSCGIPATGVVQAGGPAVGIVPKTRVYFVRDGRLVPVPRETDAPGDVDSAVELLLLGPSDAERNKRMRTDLPPGVLNLAGVPPATGDPSAAPQGDSAPGRATVTERDGEITVQLTSLNDGLGDLAADQVICTAVAAQRVADPGAEPAPVSVTDPGGRRVEGTPGRCPDG